MSTATTACASGSTAAATLNVGWLRAGGSPLNVTLAAARPSPCTCQRGAALIDVPHGARVYTTVPGVAVAGGVGATVSMRSGVANGTSSAAALPARSVTASVATRLPSTSSLAANAWLKMNVVSLCDTSRQGTDETDG